MFAVREQLTRVNLSDVEVRQLFEVALDMGRRQRTADTCKQWVDVVPRQQTAVETAAKCCLIGRFGEVGRHARYNPSSRLAYIDCILCILEVVQIRRPVLCSAALSCYQLCKFGRERDMRRLRKMQERNLVEHIREPLAFLLPTHIESPNSVVERFGTHIHLCRQCLFRQVHKRTANHKVLREVVFPVQTEHRFALLPIIALAFQRNVYRCTRIYNALIQYSNFARIVIDAIIRAFRQTYTACCYYHRTLRNVVCTQRNNVGTCSPILSHKLVFVFLCNLLCYGFGRIVQFREGILACLFSCNTF